MVVCQRALVLTLVLLRGSVSAPAGAAPAEGTGREPGLASTGLPGVHRVGVPGAPSTGLVVAGTAGYGYTEPQVPGDGAHHRLMGRLAVAVAPVPLLEVALLLDGRHDRHPDEGEGAYGGSVGDPRLLARLGSALGDSVRLGGELSLWMPGGDAPSVVASATTVDASALVSIVPRSGPWVATRAGFRLDNSAEAAPDRNRLRFGDRVALGLSDSSAALLGVGLGLPLGRRVST